MYEKNTVKYQEAYAEIEHIILSGYPRDIEIKKLIEYMMHNEVVSLESLSWAEIYSYAKAGTGQTFFSVGDTKSVIINNKPYTAVLLDFNTETMNINSQDELHNEASNYNGNSGKANLTFGLIELYDGTYEFHENPSNSIPIPNTLINSTLNEYILDYIPTDLLTYINPVRRYYDVESSEYAFKLFLPTEFNIIGKNVYGKNIVVGTEYQYQYYRNNKDNCVKTNTDAKNKRYSYWTASRVKEDIKNTTSYVYINKEGKSSIALANDTHSISFCFTI